MAVHHSPVLGCSWAIIGIHLRAKILISNAARCALHALGILCEGPLPHKGIVHYGNSLG